MGRMAPVEASAGGMDSVKLAEVSNLWVPENVALTSESAHAKYGILKKLAQAESRMYKIAEVGPSNGEDAVVWELRKSAWYPTLSDSEIESLREYEPADVFHSLAKRAMVMDCTSFVKYAMGSAYSQVEAHQADINERVNGIFTELEDSGEALKVAEDGVYDAAMPSRWELYDAPVRLEKTVSEFERRGSMDIKVASHLAVEATVDGVRAVIHRPDKFVKKTSSK